MMRATTDSLIEQWVLREFSFLSTLRAKELCVVCCDGVITLFGTVRDEASMRTAERVAKLAPNVVGVVNRIRVKPSTVVAQPTPIGRESRPATSHGAVIP
jgi:osmotically-inducible protein OsmY